MKKILILFFLTLPAALSAQSIQVSEIFKDFATRSGYNSVEISGEMLQALKSEHYKDVFSGIEFLRIIEEDKSTPEFRTRMIEAVSSKDYRLMASVTQDNQNTMIYQKTKGKTNEFIMISFGDEGNTLIQILGRDISVKKITGLSGFSLKSK